MPQNRGLFQRAILQSGTPIHPFSEYLGNAHLSSIIGNLNCSNSNTSAVKDCLKKLTTEQFAPALQEYFAPVVDGELLTDDPINLLMNASSEASLFFQSIDMIIGTCSSEGAFFILIAELLKDTYHFNVTEGLPKTVLCDYLAPLISKDYQNPLVSTAICNKYGQNTNSAELSMDIVNAYSDYYFNSLSVRLLRFHARGKSKRFQYLFSRMPAKSLIMPNPPPWFTGAAHGDELVYQFDFFPLSLSDMGLADAMNTYWANFARTGDVNDNNLPRWEEYDMTNEVYLDLDVNITSESYLYKDRVDFWLTDIPALLQPSTTTEPTSGSLCLMLYKIEILYLLVMIYVLCFH